MIEKKNPLLGIIGGLGPAASAYFYEMLTEHTKASCDADHIDLVLSSRASTPDRTAYIMGKSSENPIHCMISDARKLVGFGADILVMPCNTAHYFFDELERSVDVPMINIIDVTVAHCAKLNVKKVGIMATRGTISTNTYNRRCDAYGIECVTPSDEGMNVLMNIIYGSVKSGKPVDMDAFMRVSDELFDRGCEVLILGCTELSLIKKTEHLDAKYVDSLEVLAYETILACKREPQGFDFMSCVPESKTRIGV